MAVEVGPTPDMPERHASAAEDLTSARADLASIASAYDRALRRGLTERSRQTIDRAFDEADRLGRRMLAASRRLRSLERAQADSGCSVAFGREPSR
jgi:hypothetical protein